MTVHEILDHSLFGRKSITKHSSKLMGHFPVRPSLRPTVVPPNMPGGTSYTMSLVTDPPRRSARLATTVAESLPPVETIPVDCLGSESDELGWESEQEVTLDVPRDKHVIAWLERFPKYDRHVLAWTVLRSVRARPLPPVGLAPPGVPPLTDTPVEPASAWPPLESLDSPRLENLSRFGPLPSDFNHGSRDFDAVDPATPS